MLFAASMPIRQAYLNGLIPSQQRATILSFDSLVSSSGAVVAQPILGRAADAWGYPASYLISGVISALRAAVHLQGAGREGARGRRGTGGGVADRSRVASTTLARKVDPAKAITGSQRPSTPSAANGPSVSNRVPTRSG